MKRLFAVALLFALCTPLASAGIIRHVIRPVVKTAPKVVVKAARTTAHVAKTIVY